MFGGFGSFGFACARVWIRICVGWCNAVLVLCALVVVWSWYGMGLSVGFTRV